MKKYDEKLKNEVVQKVIQKVESVKALNKRLGIPESTIHTWVSNAENKILLEKNKVPKAKTKTKKIPCIAVGAKKSNECVGYSHDFKLKVVNMAKVEKKSIKEIAEKTGVSPASVSNWIAAFWKPAQFNPTQPTPQAQALLQEIGSLQKERDYYKQQMEYFMRLAFRKS